MPDGRWKSWLSLKAMYHSKMHTAEKTATQSLTWMNFLPRESGTDKLCLSGHAQVLVPFFLPRIASNSGAAVPGDSYSLLPGGTLAAVAASTDIAGLLCDPAPLSSAFILCCDNRMAEELVLSPTLNYFQYWNVWVLALTTTVILVHS